jgi:hypothetical protein
MSAQRDEEDVMTAIQISCYACGVTSELPPSSFLARLEPETATGEFLVTCPACMTTLAFRAATDVMGRLIAAGVTHLALDEPSREHPEEPPAGPALTYDDLLDLHAELESTDLFNCLTGQTD